MQTADTLPLLGILLPFLNYTVKLLFSSFLAGHLDKQRVLQCMSVCVDSASMLFRHYRMHITNCCCAHYSANAIMQYIITRCT